MEKWEYLFVDRSGILGKNGYTWINHTRNQHAESRAQFLEFCQQLGNDGWELVHAQREGQFLYLIFKRPKGG